MPRKKKKRLHRPLSPARRYRKDRRYLKRGTLCIDPGFRNTGWAYRAPSGFVYSGTVETDDKLPSIVCIGLILSALEDKLRVCETLVVEDYLAPVPNRGVVYLIGALVGYARLHLARRIEIVPNITWSKEYTKGSGLDHETVKRATLAKVRQHFKYDPQTQHEADAMGMLQWWEDGGFHYHRKKYSIDEAEDTGEVFYERDGEPRGVRKDEPGVSGADSTGTDG